MANSNAKVTRSQVLAKAMMMTEAFTAEEIEVMGKMIASIEKKSSKGGVSDKVMAERIAERTAVLEALANGPMTATEVMQAAGLSSTPKATARLKELVAEGTVVRIEGKGKTPTVFKAVTPEGEDE